MSWTVPPKAILTPCIGVCTLRADGYCEGCHRTGEEIARWSSMSDAQRLHVMLDLLPVREQAQR